MPSFELLAYFKWIWESIINAFVNTRSLNAAPYLKSDTTYEEALVLYEIPKTLHETSMLKERMHLSKRTRLDFYMPLAELYWRSKRVSLTRDAIIYAKRIQRRGGKYFSMRTYKYLYRQMEKGWTTLEDDFVFSKVPLFKNLNQRWYKPWPGKDQVIWKYIKPINPFKAPFHGKKMTILRSYGLNKYKQSIIPNLIINPDFDFVSKLESECKPQHVNFDYKQIYLFKYIFKTHQDYLRWLKRVKDAYFYHSGRRLLNEKTDTWYNYVSNTRAYYYLALKVHKLTKYFSSSLAFNKKPTIHVENLSHISDVMFSDQDILNLHPKKNETGSPGSRFVLRVPWRWRRNCAYYISDFTWNPVKNKTLQDLKKEDIVDYAFYRSSQDIKEILEKMKYMERKMETVYEDKHEWLFSNTKEYIENERLWENILLYWIDPFNLKLEIFPFNLKHNIQEIVDKITSWNYLEEIYDFGTSIRSLNNPTASEIDEVLCWETYSPSVHILKEAFDLLTSNKLPYFYRYFMFQELKFDYLRTISKNKTYNDNISSANQYIPTNKFKFDINELKDIGLVNRYWNDLFSNELKKPMPRFKFIGNTFDNMVPPNPMLDLREKWIKCNNRLKAMKYKSKDVFSESIIDVTPIYQNYMRLEFNDGMNYWYQHAFEAADKFSNIKYHLMDKYLHQMHKGVAPSDYFTCFKFKFIDNLLEIIIMYSNVYTISLVLFAFTVAFFIHIFKLIKNSDLLSTKKIVVSNKKSIKNNKNIKIIKRFYHSGSNQNRRDKKLMFKKTRKNFVETLLKSLQKIVNNKDISFQKDDIRLSFTVERGKLYKLDVLDFQAKTSNALNWYDDTSLIDYAAKHNLSKQQQMHGKLALSQLYFDYFDINEQDIYKYDHPIEFTRLDYFLSQKRKHIYKQNRIKALIRDRERALLLKKDMHFNSRFTDTKYKVLNFVMYITKYFKYILKFIALFFMFVMLSVLVWINISYLILVFYSIQMNFYWWTGFFKSGALFILSIVLFYTIIILLLFYVLIIWRIKKNKVKTSKVGSEILKEQYILEQDKFKQHFLDEMRKLNADWALLDIDLIKQKEVSKNRLKKIYKTILYIFFSLCFIISIILLLMCVLVALKSFQNDFAVQMPSLWLLDLCISKYIDLVQTFLGDLYHKGAFFDDYHFVNLVFNLYRSQFWNNWFITELEKWKSNLFEQVWQTNKIFIEKSFIFAYFLKTLGENWIEDMPVEERIDTAVEYLKSMKFYLNESPFYFARYKTSLNSLKDRIINIKVWRLQKILDFRKAYLRFKTNVINNKNLYDNWSVHIYILKLLFMFDIFNLLYFFILVCILYFIITKIFDYINKRSKIYNDVVFFVHSYLKKNDYKFSIFRDYLLDKKQLALYYRLKSTVYFINKIKTRFKKK